MSSLLMSLLLKSTAGYSSLIAVSVSSLTQDSALSEKFPADLFG